MRNTEAGLVERLVPVQQQIEVDDPWPPTLDAHSPELALDVEEQVEELSRGQARLERRRTVQEPRLVHDPDRIGLAQLRDSNDVEAGRSPEELDRTPNRLLPQAEVRAETDVCTRHETASGSDPVGSGTDRSLSLDDDRRVLHRGVEDDVGLPHAHPGALD